MSADPGATYHREWGRDIVSRDLAAAEAARVDPSEWLMMNEDGATVTPLVGRDFEVYRLPRRNARRRPNVKSQRGVRLGPRCQWGLSQTFRDPASMPPAERQVSPRELPTFLRHPDQVGYPGTINTDGCLGFSVMAYQSWGILFGHREAASLNLVRLLRPLAKGHDSPTHTPSHRGKVGLCPCCSVATYVAVPGTYCLGLFGRLKHAGLRPLAEGGFWAPRQLAAIDYVLRFNDCMPLRTGWNWAAHSLEFSAPSALVRGLFLGAPCPIPTVAQAKANATMVQEPEPDNSKHAPKRPKLTQKRNP